MAAPLDIEESETPSPARRWSQAPGDIGGLEEYTVTCTKRIGSFPGYPNHLHQGLDKRKRSCRGVRWQPPEAPLPLRVIIPVLSFAAIVYEKFNRKKVRQTPNDARERVRQYLTVLCRTKMCQRAETHDIALLPSTKPKTTMRNQTSSTWGRLPVELRLKIYDYFYAQSHIIAISDVRRRTRYRLRGHIRLSGEHTWNSKHEMNNCHCCIRNTILALPLTCRQIYAETIHRLYENATFYFDDNKLNLYLPCIMPIKHLRSITSLCLNFHLGELSSALYVPYVSEDEAELSPTVIKMHDEALKMRKEYVEFWHVLANDLINLQTLLVTFKQDGAWSYDSQQRECEDVLPPLFQCQEGKTRSSWGPNLTLFDVRLGTSDVSEFIDSYRKEGSPFFLGEYCYCTLDRRQCAECRLADDYCLQSMTGGWVVVDDSL